MLDFGVRARPQSSVRRARGSYGCADALAAVGVNLVMNARTESALPRLRRAFRKKHGVSVTEVACDIQRTKAVRRCWKRPAMWIFW